MLREESDIYPNEYNIKMGFRSTTVQRYTTQKGKSVIECPEQSENSTHRQNVMEMGHHIICIM